MIKTPEALHKGDCIDLIAPSFGCSSEPYFSRLEKAISNFSKWGYKTRANKNVYLSDGLIASNSPRDRAEEFMDSYLSEESKLILSVGGGEVMMDMLPYVDFKRIKNSKPKWFMGFSDNTNLSFLLPTLANVKAIYGPNAPSFISSKPSNSEKDALRLLSNDFTKYETYPKWGYPPKEAKNPLAKTKLNREEKIINFGLKEEKGILLGGCIDVIASLIGTKFDNVVRFNKENGPLIWMLESCDLNPLSFYRILNQMKFASYFASTKAIIFGRPMHFNEEIMGLSFIKAAKEALNELNIPLVFDISLGHLSPSLPFVEGMEASVRFNKKELEIEYHE